MEIPMIYYVVVSTIMFFAGVYGFVTRHNLLAILISLELMLNAVDINLSYSTVIFFPVNSKAFSSRFLPWLLPQPRPRLR